MYFFHEGLINGCSKDNGNRDNNMVKDIKYLHKVKIKKEFGKMENS